MSIEEILEIQFCPGFLDAMKARLVQGFMKYGPAKKESAFTDAIANARKRIAKYEETGNTEWLVDAANFVMFEFASPAHPNAHFRATSTEESPGIVLSNGRTAKDAAAYHDYVNKHSS